MEADWLRSRLESGRSIESIAREAGKHPSTVAYWVNKHGLMSHHAARHKARGPIARTHLEALVEQGLSIRQVAGRLDRSPATSGTGYASTGCGPSRRGTRSATRRSPQVWFASAPCMDGFRSSAQVKWGGTGAVSATARRCPRAAGG